MDFSGFKIKVLIMSKSIQLVLLPLVFVLCGACGYLLGEIITVQPDPVVVAEPVQEVIPEPVIQVSRVPFAAVDGRPVRTSDGNYSLNVVAVVESEEQMKYAVFADSTCVTEVASNLDGVFTGIPPTTTGVYFVRVENIISKDCSDVIPVDGFVKLIQYRKITKSELEKLFNVDKSWNAAPAFFRSSLSPNYGMNLTILGMNENERKPGSLGDICTKVSIGTWASATVESISYDDQGRLTKLVVRANY